MGKFSNRYYLKAVRARRRARAFRLGRKLNLIQDNTHLIGARDVIAFVTMHNELDRLEYFLEYYRKLGVKHFICVDNNSNDGSAEYLAQFSDVTRYFTKQEYRRAHFGMDWINWLLLKHAKNRWALTVDVDEFFVYPHCDSRPIDALTNWLDASSKRTFAGQLIDLYPADKQEPTAKIDQRDPFKVLTHFDAGNYTFMPNPVFKNLWIQGGVRARLFFSDKPDTSPALNKIPLVKWKRGFVYTSSTHQLLPTRLNVCYSSDGSEQICGALLHTKFMPDLHNKVDNPYLLSQHYSKAREYHSYSRAQLDDLNFESEYSRKYTGWRQLDQLGLISSGGWA